MRTNLQLAGSVARFVELQSVTLASATLKSSIDPMAMPESVSVSNRYRTGYERKLVNNLDAVYVDVDFGFEAAADEKDEPGDVVVDLAATFRLVYVLSPDAKFEDAALEHFAAMNGAYNAWPYWRELVQSVAGRVGLSGIVLPVFRPEVRPLPEDAGKQATKADQPAERSRRSRAE